MQFKVIREHIGDKQYAVGDIRDADEITVRHLIGKVLIPLGATAKAEPAPLNKAELAAPANKASTGRKAKPKA